MQYSYHNAILPNNMWIRIKYELFLLAYNGDRLQLITAVATAFLEINLESNLLFSIFINFVYNINYVYGDAHYDKLIVSLSYICLNARKKHGL